MSEPMMTEREAEVAAAGFRAGWRAGCVTTAQQLQEANAPADVLAFIRALADMPPPLKVSDRRSMSDEEMSRLTPVGMEIIPRHTDTGGCGVTTTPFTSIPGKGMPAPRPVKAVKVKCSTCRGTGFRPDFDGDGPMECHTCNGSGKVPR